MHGHYILIILILFSTNCQSIKYGDGQDCKHFKKLIKDHWTYNPETGYYHISHDYFRELTGSFPCMAGSSKQRIERLFGTPTEKRKNVWVYYRTGTVPCEFSNCTYYKFVFDKYDKLAHFNQGGAMMKY